MGAVTFAAPSGAEAAPSVPPPAAAPGVPSAAAPNGGAQVPALNFNNFGRMTFERRLEREANIDQQIVSAKNLSSILLPSNISPRLGGSVAAVSPRLNAPVSPRVPLPEPVSCEKAFLTGGDRRTFSKKFSTYTAPVEGAEADTYLPHLALPFYPRGRSDLSPRLDNHFQTHAYGNLTPCVQLKAGTRMGWWPASSIRNESKHPGPWY